MLKKIGIGILVIFVILQFIPIKKNQSTVVSENSIDKKYNTPENVKAILKKHAMIVTRIIQFIHGIHIFSRLVSGLIIM